MVDVLNMRLDLAMDMVEVGAVGCEKGTGGDEEKRPEPEWDVIGVECEAVARLEEKYGRYGRDLQSSNGAFSGRAHQDQPSLHMPDQADPLRPCAREPTTERLGFNDGCSQEQKPARRGGQLMEKRPRQSQEQKSAIHEHVDN
jgi:hypothetical protein